MDNKSARNKNYDKPWLVNAASATDLGIKPAATPTNANDGKSPRDMVNPLK